MIAVLAGGIPMAASPVILQPESAPAFTLDICSPLVSFAQRAGACSLPPLKSSSFRAKIEDRGTANEAVWAMVDRPYDAPDPPPPEALL